MIILNFLSKQTTLNLALMVLLVLFVLLNIYYLIRKIYLNKNPLRSELPLWSNWLTRRSKWIEILFIGLSAVIIITSLVLPSKVISPSEPALGITNISPQSPLRIEFDRRLDRDSLKHEINPALPGEWRFESELLNRREVLLFIPSQTPELNTRYTISLGIIRNYFGKSSNNYLFSFQTAPLPEIKTLSIKDGDEGVAANQELLFETDPFAEQGAKFDFALVPEVETTITKTDNTYHLVAKGGFARSTNYNLKIFRTPTVYDYKTQKVLSQGEKLELKSINFRTIDIPSVKMTSPTGGGIMTDTNISIEFKQDMDKPSTESLLSISPSVNGSVSWESNRKIIFTPAKPLVKNTSYKVVLTKGSKTSGGDTIPDDISFSFSTIGYVAVSKFTPANGANGVIEGTPVAVTFNQAVDHSSAESHFSISPAVSGTFSWSGNTMSFNHANFSTNQKYTLNISSGVKSINGLDSKESFLATFTTKTPATSLNVPSYKQAHMYSCMAVAARNALAFKGVNVSEGNVLSSIGYDTTAWSGTWAEGGAVWGDPNSGIVGNVDGKANNIGWGYGAHWNPVASAIRGFGRSADVKSGWDVSGIASEISAGNPVIVWWVNGVWPAYNVYWKTSGGKSIKGVNSMHVQVVKGFTGTVDNPLTFTVTDSGYGYPTQTFDVGTFKAKWGWFGNTAIVVK